MLVRQPSIVVSALLTLAPLACTSQTPAPNQAQPPAEVRAAPPTTAAAAAVWHDDALARLLDAQVAVLKLTLLENQPLTEAKQNADRSLQELAKFQARYRIVVADYGYTTTAYEAALADVERDPELKARLRALAAQKFGVTTPLENLTPNQVRDLLRRQ